MKRNKKRWNKEHLALKSKKRERRILRNLGYKDTNEYQNGLNVVKRLLAEKEKDLNGSTHHVPAVDQ